MTIVQEGETDVSFLRDSEDDSAATIVVQETIVEGISGRNTSLEAAFVDKIKPGVALVILYQALPHT